MPLRRLYKTEEKAVRLVGWMAWGIVGLLILFAVAAVLALHCRAEWLRAARERDQQTDIACAAEISAEYWFQKYRARTWSRPGASERNVVEEMAARHRELLRKIDKESVWRKQRLDN
jgi:hypothetical protein